MIQAMPNCPVCGEPVYRIIQRVGQPTLYFHARNNQDDIIHEKLEVRTNHG